MANISKRGDKWRAEVCIDYKRRSKTFATKREATAWASSQEEDGILAQHTFREMLEKYKPIAEKKAGAQAELSRIKSMLEAKFADKALEFIKPAMIAEYRDSRLETLSSVSVRREMIILGSIYELAKNEWGWIKNNPVRLIVKPPTSNPRRRGVAQDEIDTIVKNLVDSRTGRIISEMFLFSLETAMRLGEICNMRWADVSEKTVTLNDTKNGDRRIVPLSQKAREILSSRPRCDGYVFPVVQHVASKRFARHSINDVHFHDARSEAITRLSKKLDIMQLARMVGHRDLKSLMIYYAESPENIADKL